MRVTLKYSACSCSIEEFYRRAEWWVNAECLLLAEPPLSRISSQHVCVFMYLFQIVCLWGVLPVTGSGLFFLSPSAACVKRFLLYVRLSNDTPCYEKRPHPFQNMIPHLHAWLQHLVNIQPLVPGARISFFFSYFVFKKCKKRWGFFSYRVKKK